MRKRQTITRTLVLVAAILPGIVIAGPITVQNYCATVGGKLFVHTKIRLDGDDPFPTLLSIECDVASTTCNGVELNLYAAEKGEPISVMHATHVVGIRIAAKQGEVFSIAWGPYRTYTVDLPAGSVGYRHSSGTGNDRGKGLCSGVS